MEETGEPTASVSKQIERPIGPSIAYVPLTRGLYALISSDDGPRVGQHSWHATWNSTGKGFYANRCVRSESGRTTESLHEFLLDVRPGFSVDHKTAGETLNCLPHNLRHATRAQQAQNRRLRTDNKSGYKGVHWFAPSGKWKGQITVEGRKVHLGLFDSAELAHQAYVKAAEVYFGEFAHVGEANPERREARI